MALDACPVDATACLEPAQPEKQEQAATAYPGVWVDVVFAAEVAFQPSSRDQ